MTTSEQSLGLSIAETSDIPECDLMIQEQLESWDHFITSFLQSQDYQFLWIFITRTLKQRNLYGMYSEADVIYKTHEITITKIKEGIKINNASGWFRKTAFNVIQNLSRIENNKLKNLKKLENKVDAVYDPKYLVNEDYSEEQVELLHQNWNRLSEQERTILRLREVKNLEWKQVCEELVAAGYEKDDAGLNNRVRQKGKRALDKLRKLMKVDKSPKLIKNKSILTI
jgi:hypothetical protein